ncbi:MAG: hypothetical protein C0505_10550 [Leptothrix sp. (in: Bacteria)]|nr:hypothetical protein [Leptothrix sp. (in: b-proteobacteria)]
MESADARNPAAVFAKTAAGQQEIRQRSLRLPPLPRRLLVLVDGKRTVAELALLVPGHDVVPLLDELMAKACIEALPTSVGMPSAPEPLPTPPPPPPPAAADPLAGLPSPAYRSAQQFDMARNFMINTLEAMLGQDSRLELIGQIMSSQGAAELRQHHAAWETALNGTSMGRQVLPELRKKLFAVL